MDLSLGTDQYGRLVCTLSDGGSPAFVTASDASAAAADLVAALEDVTATGGGDCFWQEGGGQFRWMFRRDGEAVRMVVLWSTGAITGWEHVFSATCDLAPFSRDVRAALERLHIAA
jgi:hypothetical protein